MATVQQAIRALAGSAHGFSERDARFGRALAAIPHDDWSPGLLECARRMLAAYPGRLLAGGNGNGGVGASGAGVVSRPASAPPPAQARRIYREEPRNRWLLEFPYDGRLVRELKDLGLRAFRDEEGGRWLWPLYEERAGGALPVLEAAGFCPPGVLEDLRRRAGQREANLAGSAATDAEIEIPGLAKRHPVTGEPQDLYPFQRAGVAYAARVKRCWIADEQGLGKTPQGLAAVEALGAYPAVYVVPASLKENWRREAARWLPGRRTATLDGLDAAVPTGGDLFEAAPEILITNYDLLRSSSERVGRKTIYRPEGLAARLAAIKPRAIVCDEAQYLKNKGAQRSQAVAALAALPSVEAVLLLTGTPFKSRPEEILFPLRILGHLGALGGTMGFARRYCAASRKPIGGGRTAWDFTGASNLEELNARLRATCYVRRTKAEVMKELPPLRRIEVHLELDPKVMAEYRRAEDDFLSWLRETSGSAAAARAARAEALTRISGLKQIAVRGKLPAIREWVQSGFVDEGKKLVLFAHHRAAQDSLREAFGAPAIRGGAPAAEVEEAKRLFCDGDAPVIVASLMAGGVGHNLHAQGRCSSVAACELGWTPADMEQAAARVHRIGQTAESVESYWLIGAGTIDEDIALLLRQKQAVVDAAADGERPTAAAESVEDELVARLRGRAGAREESS